MLSTGKNPSNNAQQRKKRQMMRNLVYLRQKRCYLTSTYGLGAIATPFSQNTNKSLRSYMKFRVKYPVNKSSHGSRCTTIPGLLSQALMRTGSSSLSTFLDMQ